MLAFKFLREGGVGPFSRFRWPLPGRSTPGEWVTAAQHSRVCVSGIHACDPAYLATWLAAELWVIELGGEISFFTQKLVATRGRLIRRVERWDSVAFRSMTVACIERARDNTVDVLRHSGEDKAAARLSAGASADSIGVAAASWLGDRPPPARAMTSLEWSILAAGYLVDAVTYAAIDPSASVFCAAHTGLTEIGFAREQAWQSRWMTESLRLDEQLES